MRTVSTCIRSLLAIILASVATAGVAQVAGPVTIGMNEYAFVYLPSPGIGMFFNSVDQQYELRDAAASPSFWLRPQADQAMFRGRVSIGKNAAPSVNLDVGGVAHFGDGVNYGQFDPDGDLSFLGTADYLVGSNRYAFRAQANENYGLFFNASNFRYEFRDAAASPAFYIEAQTGAAISSTHIRVGGSSAAQPGNIRFTGADFQGYVGGAWQSFTAGGGGGTDDQTISLIGNTLSIEDGNSVSLAPYLDNTDGQTLGLAASTLSISGGNSVDLSSINTDAQTLGLVGSILSISGGNNVDLSGLGGGGTDDQTISLIANTLSIEDGNSVSLAPYLDNTDGQTLGLVGSILSISGGNNVDLSGLGGGGTDDQTISLIANTLSIEDGNSVSLAPYLDNTDAQTLSLVGDNLSIAGGNSVSLASYADDGDWAYVSGSGTTGEITRTGRVSIGSISDADNHGLWAQNYVSGKGAVRGTDQSGSNIYAEGMLGVLSPGSAGVPLSVTNAGVLGIKPNLGGNGAAVYGWNDDDNTTNYGGLFIADGDGTGTNYGLYADADSAFTNWAGYFDADVYIGEGAPTVTGDAVLNVETDGSHTDKGIHARVNYSGSVDVRAVEGYSVTTDGYGIGGHFTGGWRGVYGLAEAGAYTGFAYGVYGTASGSSAGTRIGVYGTAFGGITNWAGYFGGDVYVSSDLRVATTTQAAGYELSVNGEIACEELLVEDSGSWPDYVFEEDYELMPLAELRGAIDERGHLPGVPNAREVEENGILVGQMQKKMMEKIEELTLYVLELHDEVELLKAENEALKSDR